MIFSFEAGIHHVFECLGRMVSRVAGIVIIEHLDVIDYVQTYHIHEREWAPGGLIEYHPGPVNVSVVNKTVGPHVQGFFLYGPPDPVETESQELFINLQGDHAKGGYDNCIPPEGPGVWFGYRNPQQGRSLCLDTPFNICHIPAIQYLFLLKMLVFTRTFLKRDVNCF